MLDWSGVKLETAWNRHNRAVFDMTPPIHPASTDPPSQLLLEVLHLRVIGELRTFAVSAENQSHGHRLI